MTLLQAKATKKLNHKKGIFRDHTSRLERWKEELDKYLEGSTESRVMINTCALYLQNFTDLIGIDIPEELLD